MIKEPPPNSVHPKTRAQWRRWLQQNHQRAEGVWLVSYKKAAGKVGLIYDEAVEEALCFGWIDSKPGKLDDERWMVWFAPRKKGSVWSKLNKERIARLLQADLIAPAGLAKIEAAKQDGSWAALDAIDAMEIPSDLAKQFAANKQAQQFFDAFPPSAKRAILQWIASAKRPETRAKRIAETVRLAAENIRANQWQPGEIKNQKAKSKSQK